MENETKQKGVLTCWNEIGGYGFVATRKEDGARLSYFLHHSRIERIEDGGIPQRGSDVLFNVEAAERGPLAVDVEILSPAVKIAAGRIAKALSGGGN
jgi:cold shock CspA family protein